jgi:hypothetical protein
MKVKMWVSACLIGLGVSGSVQASIDPDWAGDHGSVYAHWSSWLGMDMGGNTANPNDFKVVSLDGMTLTAVPGQDNPDAQKSASVYGADLDGAWLELIGNYDLSFWMPSFGGLNSQQGWIQLSYWNDETDPSWRAGFDLGIQLYGGSGSAMAGGLVFEGETVVGGLITEAYSFAVNNSADGFFVDVAGIPAFSAGSVFLDSVTIDTISYEAIPEPTTGVIMLVGGALMVRLRKRVRS